MNNIKIFNEIFWEIAKKYNITVWYKLFESYLFNEVEQEIRKVFNKPPFEIPFYEMWYYGLSYDYIG